MDVDASPTLLEEECPPILFTLAKQTQHPVGPGDTVAIDGSMDPTNPFHTINGRILRIAVDLESISLLNLPIHPTIYPRSL